MCSQSRNNRSDADAPLVNIRAPLAASVRAVQTSAQPQLAEPMTLSSATYSDLAVALAHTGDQLKDATIAAWSLLQLAGVAGSPGDTADDLKMALARHMHVLSEFDVKVKTEGNTATSHVHAHTSCDALDEAARGRDDAPFGISVMPTIQSADLERAAMLSAHRALEIRMPLEDALKNPGLAIALKHTAKRLRPAPATDHKKLAANDHD